MRKWVVVGFILSVVAVGGYWLSQPRKGTVEWHKREYLQYTKGPWDRRIPNAIADILRLKRTQIIYEHPNQEVHRRALIRCGYLTEAEVALSHQSFHDAIRNAKRAIREKPNFGHAFVHVEVRDTNIIAVVAKTEDVPIFVEALRTADMPPSKQE